MWESEHESEGDYTLNLAAVVDETEFFEADSFFATAKTSSIEHSIDRKSAAEK